MRHETTGQPLLFHECLKEAKATPTSADLSLEALAPGLSAEGGSGPQLGEPAPSRTVSPLANMILGEVCGFCGREVRAPGYVIPDYDELGAFCNQECADRRFQMYLQEAPE